MKELCEIEGIQFYDIPEMGVACRVSKINRAITGKANRNNFKQDMLDYEHVKEAFPDSEIRKNQIQDLEYNGTGKKLFISLKLVLVHLNRGSSYKYKEGCERVLQAINENPILKSTPCFISIKKGVLPIEENPVPNSTPCPMNQGGAVKELCEIKGIKFYNTQEMGIACRVSEISTAITGKPNQGGIRRDMLTSQYVRAAFPDSEKREKQIQSLEYPSMEKQLFISLELLLLYLKKGNYTKKYKGKYEELLQGIKENFPNPKGSFSDPDIISDPNTASNSGNISPSEQQLLPTMEEEYSFLYIAKAGIMDDSTGEVSKTQDIHFGITAGDPKDRIKAITSGSYRAELVATIPFRGTQERKNGSKVACEDCVALESWFKSNREWEDIRGMDESFRCDGAWRKLLKEIEDSTKTGPPLYALYPDSPIITDLVPEYLIAKIHDFGEGLEMMEIIRFYKGDVIPNEELRVFFDGDWIVVEGQRRVKKR